MSGCPASAHRIALGGAIGVRYHRRRNQTVAIFRQRMVERLDLSAFTQSYSAEGGSLYAPELLLSVWLYAYVVGLTSARQLERRLVEDLALRYLSGGARIDNWTLSAFRRRHASACRDRVDSLEALRATRSPARKMDLSRICQKAFSRRH